MKSPKIFFYDTGLLCRLLSIRKSEEIRTYNLRGSLFENFVFIEMEKHFFNQGEKPPIYFWRDRRGYEIDFLIEGKNLKIVEVKSGQTISQDFFKNINYFKKIVRNQITSYLIYSGKETQIRKDTLVLPWANIHQIFNQSSKKV